jgi:predicted TPR repeat methyltransferase
MQHAEYYDSVATYWDDDYSDAKVARIVAATISIPRGGACVLDIGCGSGSMFMDLLEDGACEIEGVDISKGMTDVTREKFFFDPCIHIVHEDFLAHEQPGFDVLMAFNSYHHFPQPRLFLK